MTPDVKALLFDTFGTVVDWRGSLIAEFTAWGEAKGIDADWAALVDGWRGAYKPSMDAVRRDPGRGYLTLDELQRQSIEPLAAQLGIMGLTAADYDHLTLGWHRLKPWPDSVPGLTRLKATYIIAPLSNGNVALLTNLAKHAGLPWDLILSAELFKHYKPDRQVYLGAARLLGLRPQQVMLVAAHNYDLAAARGCGLKTAFVPRVTEYGPHQKEDIKAESDWDLVVKDLNDLADRLGC
ncbi:MAG: haloacid dehalogenase type II [Afipia sp.]|nr:haloacid dehalogenase type II [Afipia sp.]OJW63915.1 MAG: haloacid dehalogenase, type II [Afipia sp. 64-13]